ncbi:MAG: DUF6340 family protein [Bacteroidales bacterium]|nr:hypothetical protein [Lentimicrobiaceae bacterium]MDD5695482.1 DUF6340 family protein [Bacteroidales bacterium]
MRIQEPFKYLTISLTGLSLLILVGCTTLRYVEIEELVPADITLPPGIQVIGIVNPHFQNGIDTTLSATTADYLDENNLSSTDVMNAVLNGFRDVMDYSPRFFYMDIRNDGEIPNDTSDYIGLSGWEKIRQVSHDSVLDALVMVRLLDIVDNLYMTVEEDIDLELAGTIEVTGTWKLLDPVEMDVLDNFTSTFSSNTLSQTDYLELLFSMRSSRRRAVLDACYVSGQEYAFRITPLWQTTGRKYYTWPGDVSKQAKEFVSQEDWLSAARIWKSATSDSKRSISAMACFNMALACEIEDNLEMSLYWAKRSDTLQPYRIATQDYIQLLDQRIKDRAKLDLQMEAGDGQK